MKISMNLRKKILSGYLLITLLIVAIGFLVSYNFSALGDRVQYMTGSVAADVAVADKIVSEVLSLRLAVEKFISLNREADLKKAETQIRSLTALLEEAKKTVTMQERVDKLGLIEEKVSAYIDKFKKVAIRMQSQKDSRQSLFDEGQKAEADLATQLMTSMAVYEENADALMAAEVKAGVNALKSFVSAKAFVGIFLQDYDQAYSQKARGKLNAALGDLESVKGFAASIDQIEEYLDNFEGLAAVSLKMSEEVEKTLYPLAPEIVQLSTDVMNSGWKEMEESTESIDTSRKQVSRGIYIIYVFAVVLAIVIGWIVARIITVPIIKGVDFSQKISEGDLEQTLDIEQKDEIGLLATTLNTMVQNLRKTVGLAEEIAGGDLTVQVTTLSDRDALGHALKSMVERLSNIVAEIHAAAASVASASQHLNSTSQQMSQGSTEQASSLEEVSSSMNQVASQTRQNAENASQANKLAGETRLSAERGNEHMTQMSEAMKEISESSRNISKIIKVIDEIAFQTNLLALNAAVEAARAGRHGKGFAVVAEEVRSLAARSAKAAGETAEIIEGSAQKVEGGLEIAARTSDALQEIVGAAQKMTDLVAEIAAASNEQAQGVAQITIGLGQVDQVTQQNTAHAEESASAAEELSSQAKLLQQLVGAFTISEDAMTAHSASPYENKNQLPEQTLQLGQGDDVRKDGWGGSAAAPEPPPADEILDLGEGQEEQQE